MLNGYVQSLEGHERPEPIRHSANEAIDVKIPWLQGATTISRLTCLVAWLVGTYSCWRFKSDASDDGMVEFSPLLLRFLCVRATIERAIGERVAGLGDTRLTYSSLRPPIAPIDAGMGPLKIL